MVVNEVDFKHTLKSVSDSFKIPWLYSTEALFKGKDVFASLPTGYGSDLQSSTDTCNCRYFPRYVHISNHKSKYTQTHCKISHGVDAEK